jgi:hypothetical protein
MYNHSAMYVAYREFIIWEKEEQDKTFWQEVTGPRSTQALLGSLAF